jgi:hypothetical protein
MPHVPDVGPDAVQAATLLLYALAYRAARAARVQGDAATSVRIPRQALWDLLCTFPRAPAAIGTKLAFYAAIGRLAADHPEAVRLQTGQGRRADVVLTHDRTAGARAYGLRLVPLGYGPEWDLEAEEATALARYGLTPTAPLPDGLAVVPRRSRHQADEPRRCTGCQVTKPADAFNRRGPNGRQCRCRDCQRAAARHRVQGDPSAS